MIGGLVLMTHGCSLSVRDVPAGPPRVGRPMNGTWVGGATPPGRLRPGAPCPSRTLGASQDCSGWRGRTGAVRAVSENPSAAVENFTVLKARGPLGHAGHARSSLDALVSDVRARYRSFPFLIPPLVSLFGFKSRTLTVFFAFAIFGLRLHRQRPARPDRLNPRSSRWRRAFAPLLEP